MSRGHALSSRLPAAALVVGLALLAGDGAAAAGSAGPVEVARAGQCVSVRKGRGRDFLVNACNACVMVKVEHRRPRGGFPIHRDITMPRKGGYDLPLSYRQGRTRVVSEQSCEVPPALEATTSQCVNVLRSPDGSPVIVNACKACRAVVVERVGRGGGRTMRTYKLAGKSYLPVASNGADRARVLADRPCG